MKVIPNENTWIGFSTTVPTNLAAPTKAQLDAATELTDLVVSLTASSTGNTVPTPSLKTLFETTIPGTTTATFTADFYRDNVTSADIAWNALQRGVVGVFYVSRFGGTGTGRRPTTGDKLEVWPIQVISAANAALTSNTAQTFTLTASVPREPVENATVAA